MSSLGFHPEDHIQTPGSTFVLSQFWVSLARSASRTLAKDIIEFRPIWLAQSLDLRTRRHWVTGSENELVRHLAWSKPHYRNHDYTAQPNCGGPDPLAGCFFCGFLSFLALWFTLNIVPALTQLVSFDSVFSLGIVVSIITAVAFGYFLLRRRFGAARAEQERLHTEMETARQVQLLMLPSQAVSIPNLRVETVYLPAQEVGGDFFQMAEMRDGSLLMVMGM